MLGSEGTRVDGEDAGGEELVVRGMTTAIGFPCASTAIRTQPSTAGLLNGRARNAWSGTPPKISPGMYQNAVVSSTPAQPKEATGAIP